MCSVGEAPGMSLGTPDIHRHISPQTDWKMAIKSQCKKLNKNKITHLKIGIIFVKPIHTIQSFGIGKIFYVQKKYTSLNLHLCDLKYSKN